jgi:outer membrane protein OmpA-like peptidoglycan-associated protein
VRQSKRSAGCWVWLTAILSSGLLVGCGSDRDPVLAPGALLVVTPAVTAVSPIANAIGVPVNITAATATFSVPMAPISSAASFSVTCSAPCASPSGAVSLDSTSTVATFLLSGRLEPFTLYTATVTGASSLAGGIAIAGPYSWHFTTGAADAVPTVSATSPGKNAVAAATNSRVIASFSEPMNPLTLTSASFTLACPAGTAVPGTVSYTVNGNVATFTPTSALPASTICSATITTGATDIAGNALAANYVWTFTTGTSADSTAPTVSSTTPAATASGVAINSLVTASFSESMNPLTITNATFTLACPAGSPVPGTVGYAVNGNVATFTPTSALPASTICSATITTGVTDSAGNALAANYPWTFTTGTSADSTAPTVSSTSPAANTTGVAINSLVTASFSESMNPLTITSATFTLACPAGSPVPGTVGYAVNGNVATFTSSSALPAGTICSATITTGATDSAGNALAADYLWTFTSGATADSTAPTVSSTTPAAIATGVATNTLVTVRFSEPMNPLTITSATFTLACPAGTPVPGTVGYAVNGNVATFTPTSALPASTICSATITTGVTDSAGNALAANYLWTFSTGTSADSAAPTVIATSPAAAAIGVCVNKAVSITFSEPMNPLTISTATITLATASGASVTGLVSYDVPTDIATFTPSANLIGNPATNYTATIEGGANGVKDAAGNALLVSYVTTFTTDASVCATAPALGAAATFGGFGGSATLTNDGLATVINGDIGVDAASTTVTGLRDSGGNVYTTTPNNNGLVNGTIYTLTAPPGSVAGQAVTQARAAALVAFNSISPISMPGGVDVSSLAQCPSCGGAGGGADELAGRTLPPGVYLSATGKYDLGGASRTVGNLTLDAGGDANAVWVLQTAAGTGTLTVGLTGPATPAVPIQVLLINGAQAKNVFWYVPAGATIGTGSTVMGTLLANASITISTTGGSPPSAVITTLDGRALALNAAAIVGVTALAAMVNSHALADDSGWYVGAEAGESVARIDNGRIKAALLASGLETVSMDDEVHHFGYKLFGGYQFNRYLSLEGGYFDLGKFGFTAQTLPPGALRGNLKLRGADLDVLGTLPITQRFAIFARGGGNYARVTDSFEGSGADVVLRQRYYRQGANYKFGAGLQFDLSEHVRIRAEAERYRIDDPVENKADIDLFSIGLVYRFGRSTTVVAERPPAAPMAPAASPPLAEPLPVVVPVVTQEQQYCTILDFEFEIKQDQIQREEKEKLGVLGTFMTKYPQTTAVIEGHTDDVGTATDNMKLSQDRAQSVVSYLVETFHIAPSRLQAVGYGETRPRADNATEQGKRLNRRIDAVIACATDIAGLWVARTRVTVATIIDFDESSAEIAPKYRDDLLKVAEFLKANPTVTATVEGHTGNLQKTPELAMKVSELRARSVADYLVDKLGVPRSQVTSEGFGQTRRFAYSTSAEGRRENRRVNIILNYPN